MPKVRAQGKAFDPFWTVNRSVGPFIGDLRLQIGVSSHDDPNESSIRSQSLRIAKKFGERSEEFGACRSKVGECRRMKPFAVSTTQGERANPVGVKRLPAHGELRLLRVKLGVLRFQDRSWRSVLAVPFLALGNVDLEAVRPWQFPRWAGHRNTHFLIGCPNIPVDP